MAEDSRVHPRVLCRLPGGADGPRGPIRGTCTNLSLGGLFLAGVQLPVGALTTVFVEHPQLGRFSAQASVRHHAITPRGMGVQFTRLGTGDLELLRRLLFELEGKTP